MLLGHVTSANHGPQRDLDIDLMVRAVDAGRVIDRIAVQLHPMLGQLDPGKLGDAKIGPLANHPGTKLGCIDADCIIGPVADIYVAFRGGLDVGADTAKPHQIGRRLQQGIDQLERGRPVGFQSGQCLDLGGQGDRFGRALEDAATLRDQFGVVVLPA